MRSADSMANKSCPRCSSFLWWWRDDSGCSTCVSPIDDPANGFLGTAEAHWCEGVVVDRNDAEGVIRTADGTSYHFTNRNLCRDFTTFENTLIDCKVFFRTRRDGVANLVSRQLPKPLNAF